MLEKLKHKLAQLNVYTESIYDRFSIKNNRVSKWIKAFVFLAALFSVFYYIGIFKHIHRRPCSIHISAQTQRASIALNYYKTDMNFFKPRIQRYLDGEGITGVEFPIIYYMGAVMYKLFGFNEIYLRMISLIIVVFGLFYFYKLANEFVKSSIIATMLTIAACLSPSFLVYTPNFMPDAPSMALHLAAWYFFFKFLRTDRKLDLNLFVIFAALATLIKAIAILIFIVIICLVILDKIKFLRSTNGNLFKDHWRIIKAVIIGIVASSSWYIYATWLTKHYHYESFALKPIMIDSWEAFDKVIEFVTNLWLPYYYSYESYVLMIIAVVTIVLFVKYANRLLLSITVLYVLGSSAYVYFFLNQFRDHDYYVIAILPSVFFLLLTMGEMICRFADNYMLVLRFAFIIILFFNMKESLVHCKKLYNVRHSNSIHWWSGDYRAYEDLEPKLRKAGIKRTDKFISAFDPTYCASLYLMDQIGVAVYDGISKEEVDSYIKTPSVKYLVLNDSAKFNKLYPNNFQDKVVLHHRGLIVYKLKD